MHQGWQGGKKKKAGLDWNFSGKKDPPQISNPIWKAVY